jgi:peptide/nickel transport system substrate-binding protein
VTLTHWEICMDDQVLRKLIGRVKTGRLSRRTFVQTMIGLGLTGPLAAQLPATGAAYAQPRAASASIGWTITP